MPMGAHYSPLVRHGPSSPLLVSVFLLAALLSNHTLLLVSGQDGTATTAPVDNSVEALLRFKSSLGHTDALANWGTESPPCSANHGNWRGVLCYNGHVFGLQLENMGLTGQIDVDSLVPLEMLRTLSFMNNNFQGQMPDWRKLGALKSLYLSNNQFTGDIPDDAFKDMMSLKKIHLANNNFTGPIPSSLTTHKVVELSIENNQFTGPIPDFPDIKLFNVSNNQLEGEIPKSLVGMDATAFAGNKGLCGAPLASECSIPSPPPEEKPSPPPTTPSPPLPPLTPPPSEAPSNNESSGKLLTAVAAVSIALVAVVIILLVYRRSRKDDTPQLGRIGSSYVQNQPPQDQHQVVEIPTSDVSVKSKKASDSGKLSFVREDRERFDLQDLLRASAEVLGSGNFGSSYKAILMDGKAVVVKRFKQMNNVKKDDFHEHMRRLGRLNHPNLLPVVAYYYRKEEKLLVFDHVHNGSLAGRLHGKHSAEKPVLDWATRLKIVKGVAKGLVYLHDQLPSLTVPHGHLKSSNVLLDQAFNPMLMDYALVPVVNSEQVHNLLLAYKSPEYSQNKRVTRKTDVWCLGILILEILTAKLPATYLAQGFGYNAGLAGWVNSIVAEENGQVFDKEMGSMANSEGEMRKLLAIGAACCDEDLENRWDLEMANEKIHELKEYD